MHKLILAVSLTLLVTSQTLSQEILGDPRVEFLGPPGQTIIFSVRYFDDGVAGDTLQARSLIGPSQESEQLEFGHNGIHINAISTTTDPITLRLLDGERSVLQIVTKGVGEFGLRFGSVPKNDKLEIPRALPDAAERQVIERFLDALAAANTRDLVSDSVVANIDWQTLDSYCTALTQELGQPTASETPLNGWTSWEGSLGARVLGGRVKFPKGTCLFKLMILNERLVDVEPTCKEMPDDWLLEVPASVQDYVDQATALAKAIFAGDAARAHEQFSPRFHDEVTLAMIEKLSAELRGEFGDGIETTRLLQTTLTAWEEDSATKRLSIDSELSFASGKQCISRVDFAIPVGKDTLAKAHLASINVREAWQSAHPKLANKVTLALQQISTQSPKDAAEAFINLLHTDVQPFVDRDRLDRFFATAAERLGRMKSAPEYSFWSASTTRFQTAIGPVEFERQPTSKGQSSKRQGPRVEVNFSDGKIVGLTIWADDYSASTLDAIQPNLKAIDLGKSFWSALLEGRFSEAHQCLGSKLQEQLPLADFEELVARGIAEHSPLNSVQIDVLRIVDRNERAQTAMLAGFYVASFEDGSLLPLHCEFRSIADSPQAVEIASFTTDFSARFPLASHPLAERFFTAFLHGGAVQVSDLTNAKLNAGIDKAVLQAFLDNLHDVLETRPSEGEIPASLVRQYAGGKQTMQLASRLPANPDDIAVEAEFESGALRTFQFNHPQLASFVARIQDRSGLQERMGQFLTAWLNGNTSETSKYFVASLRTPVVEKRLTSVCNDYNLILGDFAGFRIISSSTNDESNQIQFEIELQYAKGNRVIKLMYDVNAFTGYISAVLFDDR